ncbi:MAG: LysR family transcriptional regulator [Cereibacter sp.]|jgi:DNA-binding transcriptional LysR family regulator|nr:LysR family transcriptional regulator [Cereibacter sp.]
MKINSENLNINLRHLRALHAVAEAGSFSAAAAALGIVPSALSEIVRQIEDSVGAALFDRSSRPATVTPLGQAFLDETGPLMLGLDRAVTRLRQTAGLEAGSLSIGASPSAISELLAPLLAEFMRDHPALSCMLHDDIAERLARMVAEGQLDLAVAGRALRSPDLRQRPILRDAFGLACPADHPLVAAQEVQLADVAAETLIGLDPDSGASQLLLQSGAVPRALLQPRITAYSTIAQLCLIRAGLGVGLLPQNAVTLFNDPRIRFVPLADLELWRTLYLIEPAQRPPSPAGRAFVAALERRFDHLAAAGE